MPRALLGLSVLLAACGTTVSPAPSIDAARSDGGHDAGRDGGHDAGRDGGRDASDLDAGLDASDLDAGLDANTLDAPDAGIPIDVGPFDAAIVRTADPPTHPSASPIAPFTECTVSTFVDEIDPITGAPHLLACAAIPYPYYPPSAGPHYSVWASFHTYTAPVPWGFLVHSLEHGGMVFAYHCANDADCDPVRAELASIIGGHGLDPVCRLEDSMTRFIVVPDPTLPVPIAAIAWRNVYEATCLDPTSLRAFVDAHYGRGSESLCMAGLDGSDAGWCP